MQLVWIVTEQVVGTNKFVYPDIDVYDKYEDAYAAAIALSELPGETKTEHYEVFQTLYQETDCLPTHQIVVDNGMTEHHIWVRPRYVL